MALKSSDERTYSSKGAIVSQDAHKIERIYHGLGVSRGIAIGPLYIYTREELDVQLHAITLEEVDHEISRFKDALDRSLRELKKITTVAREKLGEKSAAIFEAQSLMLQDATLFAAVTDLIQDQHSNANSAIRSFISESRSRMEASGSAYFSERANDLRDVQDRLLRNLERGKLLSAINCNSIVVSESLTAADIVLFSRRNILGCVMQQGGVTSHVSLMAKGLGVPAIVNIDIDISDLAGGELVILDGLNGRLIVNASETTIAVYERLRERYHRLLEDEKTLVPLSSSTIDGESIQLHANLEFKEELELVKQFGAQAIGLFRTEFLFWMHGFREYGEADQYDTYRAIVESVSPHTTTFRLLDFGGDKLLPVARRESNPVLGWRGIRVLLDRPELLRPQLRALLRAARHGSLRILVPMVTAIQEIVQLKEVLGEVEEELKLERIPYNADVPLGIMVEVPAVALMADRFAREVDFFAIGTNDLTQYILAVDRGNNQVAHLYQELDPAVLVAIKCTVDAARKHEIPVSVCGDMASNPLATALLIGLGVNELSAPPSFLPEIKRVIRSMRRQEAEELVHTIMTTFDVEERKDTLMAWLHEHAPDYFAFLQDSERFSAGVE